MNSQTTSEAALLPDGNQMHRSWPRTWRIAAFVLLLGLLPAGLFSEDLSTYRGFQLGADVESIATEAGVPPSQATVIHQRPALIQKLLWHPQPLGPSPRDESVKEVAFGFYNGELFRIDVLYDRYQTEGLTAADMVEALSAIYGSPAQPEEERPDTPPKLYGEQEDTLAMWQDALYRVELIRVSFGPTYKLVSILKQLEQPAQAAALEAERLDRHEAPQRRAEQDARDEESERIRLEKARSENKPDFRP